MLLCMDINWQALLAALRDRGWQQKAICDRVGLAQGTLSDLSKARHGEPRYASGAALVSLYREVVGMEPPLL